MIPEYIGIDIGTTSTKAVVFAPDGQVLFQVSRNYDMFHPEPNWSIQKPSDLVQAVQECIKYATENHYPVFIAFSSAMHSLLLINEAGEPLTDCLLWADNRAEEQANQLKQSPHGKRMYEQTGIPLHSFSPFTKLLWFKETHPELFAQAYKFISAKEYVWYQLTGKFQVDSSMASGTGLMNLHTLDWEPEILDFLGIQVAQLSEIVPPTYTAKGQNAQYTFVIGAGDGPLASLGTGAMNPGKMALTIGTSGAVRLPVAQPVVDPYMRTQCYHLIDDQYLTLGAVNNGAVVLQWLKESVLKTNASFDFLFDQAAEVAPGADGLLFIPYLLGERAPIWDSSVKGSLIGMTINHEQAHFVRATLEGIVLGLFHVTEVLIPMAAERQKIELRVSGGFAKSELWLQIVADIFQMKVSLAQTVEGSAWGAVLLGFKAFGIDHPFKQEEDRIFEPNPTHEAVYAEAYLKFKMASAMLREF
jgi:gluconokinase